MSGYDSISELNPQTGLYQRHRRVGSEEFGPKLWMHALCFESSQSPSRLYSFCWHSVALLFDLGDNGVGCGLRSVG